MRNILEYIMSHVTEFIMEYRIAKRLETFHNDFKDIQKRVVSRNYMRVLLSDEDLKLVNQGRYSNNNNLLLQAVLLQLNDAVAFLVRIQDLDVNYRNKNGETAADIAWKEKKFGILLTLLKYDSRFPEGFSLDEVDENETSRELEQFVKGRVQLHQWIVNGDLQYIISYTSENESSTYYDPENVNAPIRAILHRQCNIYTHFSSIGVKLRLQERNLKVLLNDPKEFAKAMEFLDKNDPNSLLLKFFSASEFRGNPTAREIKVIEEMMEYMSNSAVIGCLMKAFKREDFHLTFDMNSDSDNDDPRYKVLGQTERNGRITILARGCAEDHRQLYCTFAHELGHSVMDFMYENNFKPYTVGFAKREMEFTKICEKIKCLPRKELDMVIREVFDIYSEREHHKELIVSVVHILAMYGHEKGEEILLKHFSELYDYFLKYIIPDCVKYSKRDKESCKCKVS